MADLVTISISEIAPADMNELIVFSNVVSVVALPLNGARVAEMFRKDTKDLLQCTLCQESLLLVYLEAIFCSIFRNYDDVWLWYFD